MKTTGVLWIIIKNFSAAASRLGHRARAKVQVAGRISFVLMFLFTYIQGHF